MVNNNGIPFEVKKPVETVYEIEKCEIKKSPLSLAARGKVNNKSGSNYISENKDDYGPCRNTLCGCSCSSDTCKCLKDILRAKEKGSSLEAYGKKWNKEIDSPKDMEEFMFNRDVGASGQISASLLGYRDRSGDFKYMSGTAGGEIGRKSIKGKLSADLINLKSDGVQVRVGVGVDTGISVEDGLEFKAIGFGFSVGKQTGISTPFGEIKVDTEDKCIIQ